MSEEEEMVRRGVAGLHEQAEIAGLVELGVKLLGVVNGSGFTRSTAICALASVLLATAQGTGSDDSLKLRSEIVIAYIRQLVRDKLGEVEPS